MSYSVKLTDELRRQIAGWSLPSHVIREILNGLDALATSPSRHLVRVGPPVDALQYDLIIPDPEDPSRDYMFTFSVLFAADEETLQVHRCETSPELSAPEPVQTPPIPPLKFSSIVAAELERYFRHLAARVDRAVYSLPPEQRWVRPFPFGNSVGHLVLHLTGNLNHYVGAKIAGTGYVRNRHFEFTDPEPYAAEVVLEAFHEAVEMVVRTVHSLDAEGFAAEVSEELPIETRFGLLLVCAAHLNNHIGQMSYLVQAHGHGAGEPPVW